MQDDAERAPTSTRKPNGPPSQVEPASSLDGQRVSCSPRWLFPLTLQSLRTVQMACKRLTNAGQTDKIRLTYSHSKAKLRQQAGRGDWREQARSGNRKRVKQTYRCRQDARPDSVGSFSWVGVSGSGEKAVLGCVIQRSRLTSRRLVCRPAGQDKGLAQFTG